MCTAVTVRNNTGFPYCLDLEEGPLAYLRGAERPSRRYCTLTWPSVFSLRRVRKAPGMMALVEPTPDGYRVKRFLYTYRTYGGGINLSWSVPVPSAGWLRRHDIMLCYDLRERQELPYSRLRRSVLPLLRTCALLTWHCCGSESATPNQAKQSDHSQPSKRILSTSLRSSHRPPRKPPLRLPPRTAA